jgi:hypothetical protein
VPRTLRVEQLAPRHLLTVEVLGSGLPAEFDGSEAVQEVGVGIASSGQEVEDSNPMNGDAVEED